MSDLLNPIVVVVLCCVVLALGVWFGAWWRDWRMRGLTRRSRSLGQRGARRGLKLLKRSGYRILDTEVCGDVYVEVDGDEHVFTVRADAVVERRGRRFIAEIKGGPDSADIAHRRTRRQLLEYARAFDVDELLLVDANAGVIHEVYFP